MHNCCDITDQAFDEQDAAADIRAYRKRGPAVQTRKILTAIRAAGITGASLLDVGGGIGAIHHELLADIVQTATHVDASAAYLKHAKDEAARRGHLVRVTFVHGDFAHVASRLPKADVVTLDRVVCCYPDFRALLRAAAGRCSRLLAMSYPREVWYFQIARWAINLFQVVRRDPFRVFLHPIGQMNTVLTEEGLRPISVVRTFVWEVALYARQ